MRERFRATVILPQMNPCCKRAVVHALFSFSLVFLNEFGDGSGLEPPMQQDLARWPQNRTPVCGHARAEWEALFDAHRVSFKQQSTLHLDRHGASSTQHSARHFILALGRVWVPMIDS